MTTSAVTITMTERLAHLEIPRDGVDVRYYGGPVCYAEVWVYIPWYFITCRASWRGVHVCARSTLLWHEAPGNSRPLVSTAKTMIRLCHDD